MLLLLHGGDRLHHGLHQLCLHSENLMKRLIVIEVLALALRVLLVLLVAIIAILILLRVSPWVAAGMYHLTFAKRSSENKTEKGETSYSTNIYLATPFYMHHATRLSFKIILD